jgi:hypothetical protein
MRPIFFLSMLSIALGVFGGPPAFAATTFTDRTSWEAAAGAVTTDTFSNPISAALSITFDSGIQSQMTGTETQLYGYINSVQGDGPSFPYEGFVNQGGYYQTLWTFPTPVTAFGGDFSHVNIPNGLTVTGNFDGSGDQTISIAQLFTENQPPGEGEGFFGLVSSVPFQSILFRSNDGNCDSGCSGDAFYVDKFSFNSRPSSVPLPTAFPLFASGLGALGLLGWRKKRKKAAAIAA